MKLIIDIDDEQILFDIKNRGLEAETETDKVIINAIYNGTPLDDVKAEIMQLDYELESFYYASNDMLQAEMVHTICREEVLQILDNIGKESEGA